MQAVLPSAARVWINQPVSKTEQAIARSSVGVCCLLTLQTALAQAYKGAGHEGAGNLLLGIANKNVSLWDFRTAQGAVAEYQDGHAYTSGKGFTAIATGGSTGSSVGTAVVADAKGGIKVF